MWELLLLRHGKSDWPNGVEDIDRPLRSRGYKDSVRIGIWLVNNNLQPKLIYSSPALRAVATAGRVKKIIRSEPTSCKIEPIFYYGSHNDYLDEIRSFPSASTRVMVVAHNPALEIIVSELSGGPQLFFNEKLHMLTCSLAIFRFEKTWKDINPGAGKLLHLIHPKTLPRTLGHTDRI